MYFLKLDSTYFLLININNLIFSLVPTEERIKDVTAIIQSIREVELTIHPNIKRHV